VVLYEMLTGQRPFKGDDVTDTLASVLKDTPAFDELPASTPPRLRWILGRCLERDPRARLRDIGEARVQLAATARGDLGGATWRTASNDVTQDGDEQLVAATRARRYMLTRAVLPLVAVASLAMVFAVVGFSRATSAPAAAPVTRMSMRTPEYRVRAMAVSPSGRVLAYLGDNQVLIRNLSSDFELKPVAATDLGRNLQSPVFSPDGEWIAFYAVSDRMIRRVSVHGGAALPVCQSLTLGLDWDASGIVLARRVGVARCNPAGGGALEQLATIGDDEAALTAQILPGGEHLLLRSRGSRKGVSQEIRGGSWWSRCEPTSAR